MMRDDAWKVYENWRSLWLSGGDSNAIAALRLHGLRGALVVTGTGCNRTGPRPPSPTHEPRNVTDQAIAEAASQVRRLLSASLPRTFPDIVRKNQENRHV